MEAMLFQDTLNHPMYWPAVTAMFLSGFIGYVKWLAAVEETIIHRTKVSGSKMPHERAIRNHVALH